MYYNYIPDTYIPVWNNNASLELNKQALFGVYF